MDRRLGDGSSRFYVGQDGDDNDDADDDDDEDHALLLEHHRNGVCRKGEGCPIRLPPAPGSGKYQCCRWQSTGWGACIES